MISPLRLALPVFFFISVCRAAVTVYYVEGASSGSETSTAAAANYTGSAAYSSVILDPPALPSPLPATSFFIQLLTGGTSGVSIKIPSNFYGFSIEFSVINQVLGKNSSYVQVPFLNLMANIVARAGSVRVRVGGNTQDFATLVGSLADGKLLEKDTVAVSNPTETPPTLFTPDVLYLMNNISALTNVKWYLGIPFNDTNWRLGIVEYGQRILGSNLIGFQAGNEPDLYVAHDHRPTGWGIPDYNTEYASLIAAMTADTSIHGTVPLIGPSVSGASWTPEEVWNSGYVDTFNENLAFLAVEHYPADNCVVEFNTSGTAVDPQTEFPLFLSHTAGVNILAPYLNSTAYAQTKNKQFHMFETNTASCGGFPGISDSFGAALWGLDYGLQMAYSNFSGALLHSGGQNVYYNPFTPPPTNQSSYHQWTIGPVYYSALIMAEALGNTNSSQVLDLNANSANIYTPAYAIFESGEPVRLALFNFMTDSSGTNDYTVTFAVGGSGVSQANATPSQIRVKYFVAESVSVKSNYTWAGQTFGATFESDGRLQGTEDVQIITCSTPENTCAVTVPAPGFALVFLSDAAFTESQGTTTMTYATTAVTRTVNTVTVDPTVLATSNGHVAMNQNGILGSTSSGSNAGVHSISVGFLSIMVTTLLVGSGLLAFRAM